jgi:hypothetical protein
VSLDLALAQFLSLPGRPVAGERSVVLGALGIKLGGRLGRVAELL